MHSWLDILKKRVLVFDGAMGTQVHKLPLDIERDYRGRENCPEVLNLSCPEAIQSIHQNYLLAGVDVVETNTFGGSKLVLSEFNLVDRCREINTKRLRSPAVPVKLWKPSNRGVAVSWLVPWGRVPNW